MRTWKHAEARIVAIRFPEAPPIGTTFQMANMQTYELVRVEPYLRADGEARSLLVWRYTDPETNQVDECKTSRLVQSGKLNRRAGDNKRPRMRVGRAAGEPRLEV